MGIEEKDADTGIVEGRPEADVEGALADVRTAIVDRTLDAAQLEGCGSAGGGWMADAGQSESGVKRVGPDDRCWDCGGEMGMEIMMLKLLIPVIESV